MLFDNVTMRLALMSCYHLTLIRLFVCFAHYSVGHLDHSYIGGVDFRDQDPFAADAHGLPRREQHRDSGMQATA